MSTYPTDDPSGPTTPIFDQTVAASAVHPDESSSARSDSGTGGQAKQAAGQAADTAKNAAGQAKDTAKDVGATAVDAGRRVTSTTKDEASKVASDAAGQAKELYGQATAQLSEQAGKQQKNAASTLRTFGGDLRDMHQQQDGGGLAAELVQTLSQRAERIADWLEDREPAQVLDEVKQFAARRPGLFIGMAAFAGIVAARATKALTADAKPAEPATGSGTTDVAPASDYSARIDGVSGYDAPVDPYGATGAGFGDVR